MGSLRSLAAACILIVSSPALSTTDPSRQYSAHNPLVGVWDAADGSILYVFRSDLSYSVYVRGAKIASGQYELDNESYLMEGSVRTYFIMNEDGTSFYEFTTLSSRAHDIRQNSRRSLCPCRPSSSADPMTAIERYPGWCETGTLDNCLAQLYEDN